MPDFCRQIAKQEWSKEKKQRMTQKTYDLLLKKVFKDKNFTKITDKQIEKSFRLVDRIYFNDGIMDWINESDSTISFKSNGRLTSTAGRCDPQELYLRRDKSVHHGKFLIEISKPIFLGLFQNGENAYSAGGLLCHDRVSCFLNTLQHEIVHLLMFINCPDDTHTEGGHGPLFKKMAFNLFGFTQHKHMFGHGDAIEREENIKKYKKELRVGDKITTKSFRGDIFTGIVIKKNPKRVLIAVLEPKKYKNTIFSFDYSLIDSYQKGDGQLPKGLIKTPEELKANFKAEQRVFWKTKNGWRKGIIKKLNKKRALVQPDDDKNLWTIPYDLLSDKKPDH